MDSVVEVLKRAVGWRKKRCRHMHWSAPITTPRYEHFDETGVGITMHSRTLAICLDCGATDAMQPKAYAEAKRWARIFRPIAAAEDSRHG